METWRYTATTSGGLGVGLSKSPYDVPVESLDQGMSGLGSFLGTQKQELGGQLLWVSLEISLRGYPWDTPDDDWQEMSRLG